MTEDTWPCYIAPTFDKIIENLEENISFGGRHFVTSRALTLAFTGFTQDGLQTMTIILNQ